MKILFVDDDPNVLMAYERQLRKVFDVHMAGSGQEGLVAIGNDAYAVIISDMRMPGMNGLEFLERARTVSPCSIQILLTGNPGAIEPGDKVNIFRCLGKPCPRECLSGAIQEAMEAHARLVQAGHEGSPFDTSNTSHSATTGMA